VIESRCSNACKNIIKRLLEKKPAKRLGSVGDLEEIKNHEWFADINWEHTMQR